MERHEPLERGALVTDAPRRHGGWVGGEGALRRARVPRLTLVLDDEVAAGADPVEEPSVGESQVGADLVGPDADEDRRITPKIGKGELVLPQGVHRDPQGRNSLACSVTGPGDKGHTGARARADIEDDERRARRFEAQAPRDVGIVDGFESLGIPLVAEVRVGSDLGGSAE